jgi:hypothetical protein
MVERKSPVGNDERCAVVGCDITAERSISKDLAEEAGMKIEESSKRAHLCKEHYKEYKKKSKEDRKIGLLGHKQT